MTDFFHNFITTSGKHVREMYTPLDPIFYSKTVVKRGILFLLFLFQNIDCGYLLGGSIMYREAVLSCTHNQCFLKKNYNISFLFT